jgi:ligand-binding sensor domain-containing protein
MRQRPSRIGHCLIALWLVLNATALALYQDKQRNTPQIKENNIQALYEDREGNLWAGTEGGGLVRFRDGRFTAYTTDDGLADNIVDAIFQDHEGSLWIGTLGGLNRFKDGNVSPAHP